MLAQDASAAIAITSASADAKNVLLFMPILPRGLSRASVNFPPAKAGLYGLADARGVRVIA
jgi:hypothetical protein